MTLKETKKYGKEFHKAIELKNLVEKYQSELKKVLDGIYESDENLAGKYYDIEKALEALSKYKQLTDKDIRLNQHWKFIEKQKFVEYNSWRVITYADGYALEERTKQNAQVFNHIIKKIYPKDLDIVKYDLAKTKHF